MYTDFRNTLCDKLATITGIYNDFGTIMSSEATIDINGRKLLNFRNPDCLGLSNSFAVESAQHTVQGTTEGLTLELEKKIAKLLNTDSCIIFNSQADAHCALTNHLLDRTDAVIYGAVSQFSTTGSASTCKPVKYKCHDSIDDLEKQLKLSQAQQNRLLIVDAIDIATGSIAPLNQIMAVANRYKAVVAIDETLSVGAIGNNGQGICDLFGEDINPEIKIGSLRNFGCNCGAFVAGRREIVDWLRQQNAPVTNSAPLTHGNLSSANVAFDMCVQMNAERQYLLQITNLFIKKLYCIGFEIPPTQSYQFALMVESSAKAEQLSATLARNGILVSILTTPFVGKDSARLIIRLSTKHTESDIVSATEVFKRASQDIL